MARQRVTVLGATGSVGTSTLKLIGEARERFEVVALTAQTNVERLAASARMFHAKVAVIGDPECYRPLQQLLSGSGIEVAAGPEALSAAAALEADCVVAAMMGAAGLKPALAAVGQGRRVALANKECLVAAGALFMATVARTGAKLLPVDSEHSAVMQSIGQSPREAIERIVLTASGGPFRTCDLAQLAEATPAQALKHPNWSMGRKITIDSATMMNKGLEVIEAYHLFAVRPEQLAVLIHPQSIVHALVEFHDGSVMAQLAMPDMMTPIACALAWPGRMPAPTARLDLVKLGQLSFAAPDRTRFRCLALAEQALVRGGAATAILNAANEVAVEAFLDGRIGFLDIADIVERCLDAAEARHRLCNIQSIDDILHVDSDGRRLARECVAVSH